MDNITSEPLPSRVKDIRGMKFGRMTPIKFLSKGGNNGSSWLFRCDCGKETISRASSVVSGSIRSCGCITLERLTKHGHYGTPTYGSWMAMKSRCNRPDHMAYHRYGGRGITVCEEWNSPTGFTAFLADMGERPRGTTIDRINNDLGYSKENCRWATPSQQRLNCEDTRFISWNGTKRQINEWVAITGIKASTIRERIKRGWPIDDVFTRPSTKKKPHVRKFLSEPNKEQGT